MDGPPASQLSFILCAASDTLSTPLNLKGWRDHIDFICYLCSTILTHGRAPRLRASVGPSTSPNAPREMFSFCTICYNNVTNEVINAVTKKILSSYQTTFN